MTWAQIFQQKNKFEFRSIEQPLQDGNNQVTYGQVKLLAWDNLCKSIVLRSLKMTVSLDVCGVSRFHVTIMLNWWLMADFDSQYNTGFTLFPQLLPSGGRQGVQCLLLFKLMADSIRVLFESLARVYWGHFLLKIRSLLEVQMLGSSKLLSPWKMKLPECFWIV